jgi:hypothetical protein
VVRFINDDGAKIGHQLCQALAPAEGLHTGDHYGRLMIMALGFDHTDLHARIDPAEFIDSLLDEFIAVGQDEGTARAPLDQEGKHDGFARTRRQGDEGSLQTVRSAVQDSSDGFFLIGPGGEPEGAR